MARATSPGAPPNAPTKGQKIKVRGAREEQPDGGVLYEAQEEEEEEEEEEGKGREARAGVTIVSILRHNAAGHEPG
ncbi:hypothetical protein E2C01_074194 [Portunus trituberculatus]|uniref:Uncharacterized protein n=1 Tax=Portunus trituberculatus TaxID=210409 RepID=A0A5B7IDQ3_PORTR|nr:hypothetical protein [Portunus trituberculatus]